MRRLRALGYSGAVAAAVFVYLALPTLRELYGPVVNIPVYTLVALVAGGATWAVLSERGETPDHSRNRQARLRRGVEEEGDDGEGTEDVDEELARLRENL